MHLSQDGMTEPLFEELSEQADDATINQAVQRIQKNELSGTELTRVLQKCFSLPQFEQHLSWLSSWVQDKDLNFLIREPSDYISTEVFYRTLRFLDTNLSHPNCGEILNSLLHTFENFEIEQLAEQWLIGYGLNYGEQSDDALALISSMTSRILGARDETDPLVAELAFKTCRAIRDDSFILTLAMIEHIPGSAVEALALEMLKSKGCLGSNMLAGPLLARNPHFENEIRDLISKSEPDDRKLMLSEVGFRSIIGSKIAVDYLQGCPDLELVGTTLQQILSSTPSEQVAAFAWQWFSENQNGPDSFELLEAILSCEDFHVPDKGITTAFEWCKQDPENDFWARMLSATIKRAPTAEHITYAVENFHKCQISPDEARIMLAINAKTNDRESHNLVMTWMNETLLKVPKDRFASQWLIGVVDEVRDKRPESSSELNDFLENLLRRTNSEVGSIYARLINVGKLSLIPEAYRWLFNAQLERRWQGLHHERGELIKALLPHSSGDMRLLTLTQSWLERGRNSYDRELQESVREAFELAKLIK